MTSIQESKTNMYSAVDMFLNKYKTELSVVPALGIAIPRLNGNVGQITNVVQEQSGKITGHTLTKAQAAETLIKQTVGITSAAYAMAVETGNINLKEEMRINSSNLRSLKDKELLPACKLYHEKATKFLRQLEPYGITEAVLTRYDEAIAAYASTIPAPRNATARKSTLVVSLNQLIRETDLLLKDTIDKLMESFRSINPELATEYFKNRIIVSNATTTTQLKAVFTTGADAVSVAGVVLVIKETDAKYKGNIKGRLLVKPAPAGIFTFEVSAPGFAPQTIPEYRIFTGQVNNLAVDLQKV